MPTNGSDPASFVRYRNLDNREEFIGYGQTCYETSFDGTMKGIATHFYVVIDSSEPWFYRTSKRVPNNSQMDLQSAVTHELGHAAGQRVHFNDEDRTAAICRVGTASNPNLRRETMCSGLANGRIGALRRSLEQHERDMFVDAYNSPLLSTPRTLTVTKIGTGRGTVTSLPVGINCDLNGSDCNESTTTGKYFTLTATPETGSRFVGWTGGPCVTDTSANPCRIYVEGANRTVTARFDSP